MKVTSSTKQQIFGHAQEKAFVSDLLPPLKEDVFRVFSNGAGTELGARLSHALTSGSYGVFSNAA